MASRFSQPMNPEGHRRAVYGQSPTRSGYWVYFLEPRATPDGRVAFWAMADGQPIHVPDQAGVNEILRRENAWMAEPGESGAPFLRWSMTDRMEDVIMQPLTPLQMFQTGIWHDETMTPLLERATAEPNDYATLGMLADRFDELGFEDEGWTLRDTMERRMQYPYRPKPEEPPPPPDPDAWDQNAPFDRYAPPPPPDMDAPAMYEDDEEEQHGDNYIPEDEEEYLEPEPSLSDVPDRIQTSRHIDHPHGYIERGIFPWGMDWEPREVFRWRSSNEDELYGTGPWEWTPEAVEIPPAPPPDPAADNFEWTQTHEDVDQLLAQTFGPGVAADNEGIWRLPFGDGREMQVAVDDDTYTIVVNFFNADGTVSGGHEVRSGTMDLVRALQRLATQAKSAGLNFAYGPPPDKRRARLYAQALSSLGYIPHGYTRGVVAWENPGVPMDADTQRRMLDTHLGQIEARTDLPDRYAQDPGMNYARTDYGQLPPDALAAFLTRIRDTNGENGVDALALADLLDEYDEPELAWLTRRHVAQAEADPNDGMEVAGWRSLGVPGDMPDDGRWRASFSIPWSANTVMAGGQEWHEVPTGVHVMTRVPEMPGRINWHASDLPHADAARIARALAARGHTLAPGSVMQPDYRGRWGTDTAESHRLPYLPEHDEPFEPYAGPVPTNYGPDLDALLRRAFVSTDARRSNEDPIDIGLVGALADALDEDFPGNPHANLIRRRHGLADPPLPTNREWLEMMNHGYYWHTSSYGDRDVYHPRAQSGMFNDLYLPPPGEWGDEYPFASFLRHTADPISLPAVPLDTLFTLSRRPGSFGWGHAFELPPEEIVAIEPDAAPFFPGGAFDQDVANRARMAQWDSWMDDLRERQSRGEYDNATAPAMYGPDEDRLGFEQSLLDNPWDGYGHQVYADWLDENGHPAEAALRRRFGTFLAGEHGPANSPDGLPFYTQGDRGLENLWEIYMNIDRDVRNWNHTTPPPPERRPIPDDFSSYAQYTADLTCLPGYERLPGRVSDVPWQPMPVSYSTWEDDTRAMIAALRARYRPDPNTPPEPPPPPAAPVRRAPPPPPAVPIDESGEYIPPPPNPWGDFEGDGIDWGDEGVDDEPFEIDLTNEPEPDDLMSVDGRDWFDGEGNLVVSVRNRHEAAAALRRWMRATRQTPNAWIVGNAGDATRFEVGDLTQDADEYARYARTDYGTLPPDELAAILQSLHTSGGEDFGAMAGLADLLREYDEPELAWLTQRQLEDREPARPVPFIPGGASWGRFNARFGVPFRHLNVGPEEFPSGPLTVNWNTRVRPSADNGYVGPSLVWGGHFALPHADAARAARALHRRGHFLVGSSVLQPDYRAYWGDALNDNLRLPYLPEHDEPFDPQPEPPPPPGPDDIDHNAPFNRYARTDKTDPEFFSRADYGFRTPEELSGFTHRLNEAYDQIDAEQDARDAEEAAARGLDARPGRFWPTSRDVVEGGIRPVTVPMQDYFGEVQDPRELLLRAYHEPGRPHMHQMTHTGPVSSVRTDDGLYEIAEGHIEGRPVMHVGWYPAGIRHGFQAVLSMPEAFEFLRGLPNNLRAELLTRSRVSTPAEMAVAQAPAFDFGGMVGALDDAGAFADVPEYDPVLHARGGELVEDWGGQVPYPEAFDPFEDEMLDFDIDLDDPFPPGGNYARYARTDYAPDPAAGFHRAILDTGGQDTTAALAYADYLDEMGQHEAAWIIRQHVRIHDNAGMLSPYVNGPPGANGAPTPGTWAFHGGHWATPGQVMLLGQRFPLGTGPAAMRNPRGGLEWRAPRAPLDSLQGPRLARALMRRGAAPSGGTRWQPDWMGDQGSMTPEHLREPYLPEHDEPPELLSRYERMDYALSPNQRWEREAFLAALRANPEDSTSRKAFADWLQENQSDTVPPWAIYQLRNSEHPVDVDEVISGEGRHAMEDELRVRAPAVPNRPDADEWSPEMRSWRDAFQKAP